LTDQPYRGGAFWDAIEAMGGLPRTPGESAWGLFISHGIDEHEPAQFNEPGLFLISRDHTVYYESILSMPVGRPRLDDLLGGIDYWTTHGYPARGEA
jgi:hypothetical protein